MEYAELDIDDLFALKDKGIITKGNCSISITKDTQDALRLMIKVVDDLSKLR